ncbi:MAG: hypothetical protein K0R13_2339 [Propionibacteriaceae bacterium]|jgi:hypothetical protein|nr:hypothetical protein [Propionibacteriaceae bacterium]
MAASESCSGSDGYAPEGPLVVDRVARGQGCSDFAGTSHRVGASIRRDIVVALKPCVEIL